MSFKEDLITILQNDGFDTFSAAQIATEAIKQIKDDPRKSGVLIIRATGTEISWKKAKANPPARGHEIYGNILAIEAVKGDSSLWPGEEFRHDFKSKNGRARIYGLRDGSILIKGNKRLWKRFMYD